MNFLKTFLVYHFRDSLDGLSHRSLFCIGEKLYIFHIREYFYRWCQHQTRPMLTALQLYWYLIDIRVGERIEYKV